VHRHEVEALVVELDEAPIRPVQPLLAPGPFVAAYPGVEDEVVISGAGHLERIELETPETLDRRKDRCRLCRERARRSQEVASNEKPASVIG